MDEIDDPILDVFFSGIYRGNSKLKFFEPLITVSRNQIRIVHFGKTKGYDFSYNEHGEHFHLSYLIDLDNYRHTVDITLKLISYENIILLGLAPYKGYGFNLIRITETPYSITHSTHDSLYRITNRYDSDLFKAVEALCVVLEDKTGVHIVETMY